MEKTSRFQQMTRLYRRLERDGELEGQRQSRWGAGGAQAKKRGEKGGKSRQSLKRGREQNKP